jgi:hypothetical protein
MGRCVDIGKMKQRAMQRALGGPTKRRVRCRDDGGNVAEEQAQATQEARGSGTLNWADMMDENRTAFSGAGPTLNNPGAGLMGPQAWARGRYSKIR